MQVLAADRGDQPLGLDPADRRPVVVHDQQPPIRGRRSGRPDARSQPHGRLVGQRQRRGLPETQRPIAPIAPHEVGDEVVHRVGEQPRRRVELGQPATHPQHRHLVAEFDRLVDVVGDEEDRLAQFALQPQEFVLQLLADHRVDRRERLVHEHDRRVGGQRARDPHPLLLPPGELAGIAPRVCRVEPHEVEHLGRPRASLGLVPAEQPGHGGHVVQDGAVREEPGMLDDVADPPPQLGLVEPSRVTPVEPDRPGCRGDHPVDHPQGRRLATPRRPDEHRDLPGRRLEREVVDCDAGGVTGRTGIPLGHALEANHSDTLTQPSDRGSVKALRPGRSGDDDGAAAQRPRVQSLVCRGAVRQGEGLRLDVDKPGASQVEDLEELGAGAPIEGAR